MIYILLISFIALPPTSLFSQITVNQRIVIKKAKKVRDIYTKYLSTGLFLGMFSVLFFSSVDSICQDKEALVRINNSALEELPILLEKIPNGLETEYGFNDREEFNRVELLNPINVIFPSSVLFRSESIDTANVNFSSSQYWKIPVSVDGKICCFLQGMFIENNFKVFGIGENLFAQKLNNIREKLFTYNNMQRSILMFPDIKKQYIVYYNNEISYMESICISLNDFFDPALICEQSLLETLYQCKNYSEQNKFRNDEY